ncbi:MAG: DUF192 domain-containing protein [Steroidobacteraceae bacterium]
MTTFATRGAALLLFALAGMGVAPVQAEPTPANAVPLREFPRESIAIETRANFRRTLLEAWRADSPAAREQGLMFVNDEQMRPDQAMIFVYDPPEYVAMWMKNTWLSLDMLFADARGCIVTIKQGATPHSLATIESRQPVALVVELKAGTVAKQRIAVGDRVLRPDAGWPLGDAPSCTAAH